MHAYQCRLRNLQGDIIALLDSTGALVVEYKYDAWGKPISITGNLADTLGKRNPFRYRGYVYDEETGLYYLRSRYYNPEVGRFLNADTLLGKVGGLGSHNAYAYCANMPVIAADPSGQTAVETAIPIFYQLSQMDGCYPFGDFVGAFIVAGAYAIDAVTELVKPNTKEKTATKNISISTATASPTLAPDRKYQIAIAYGNIGVASVSPLLTEKRRI